MIIRSINKSDNKSLSIILREVLVEMEIPKKGSAYEDPELDKMFEAYQNPRSKYYVIEYKNQILGGAGISELRESTGDICELQKMYFHKSIRGKGFGNKMINKCLTFAIKSNYSKCYIETMPNMIKAQTLYLNKGFEYIDKPMGNTGHTACPVWMLKYLK
ncbi:MAG: GNAT family N-acetyltransferase [Flavobacteriaceae bacterium]|nr:GNAT family N-acetyltransferase [Flavobacteriaceae bacterium]